MLSSRRVKPYLTHLLWREAQTTADGTQMHGAVYTQRVLRNGT